MSRIHKEYTQHIPHIMPKTNKLTKRKQIINKKESLEIKFLSITCIGSLTLLIKMS